MATELIVCPRCGASPNAPPDAQGQYLCAYCGSRFRTHAAFVAPPVHASPPAHPSPAQRVTPQKKSSSAATVLAAIGA
ncbi:MAG: hypothetical protein ABW061_07525, partial [Polyangiaceae bacterium]